MDCFFSLEERKMIVRTWNMDRDKLQDHLIENHVTLEGIENSSPKLSEEYEFCQEMREFLNDLLDCFNEKVCMINPARNSIQSMGGWWVEMNPQGFHGSMEGGANKTLRIRLLPPPSS